MAHFESPRCVPSIPSIGFNAHRMPQLRDLSLIGYYLHPESTALANLRNLRLSRVDCEAYRATELLSLIKACSKLVVLDIFAVSMQHDVYPDASEGVAPFLLPHLRNVQVAGDEQLVKHIYHRLRFSKETMVALKVFL